MLSSVAVWVVCVTLMKGWEAAPWIDTWPSLWKTSKNNLVSFFFFFLPDSQHLHQWSRAVQNYPITSLHNSSSHSLCAGYQGDSEVKSGKWSNGLARVLLLFFLKEKREICAILFIIYFQFIFLLHPMSAILPPKLVIVEAMLRCWLGGACKIASCHLASLSCLNSCMDSSVSPLARNLSAADERVQIFRGEKFAPNQTVLNKELVDPDPSGPVRLTRPLVLDVGNWEFFFFLQRC